MHSFCVLTSMEQTWVRARVEARVRTRAVARVRPGQLVARVRPGQLVARVRPRQWLSKGLGSG